MIIGDGNMINSHIDRQGMATACWNVDTYCSCYCKIGFFSPHIIFAYISPGDACGTLSFQCGSAQCVSLSDYCDYKQDCEDGSDETECGMYCYD